MEWYSVLDDPNSAPLYGLGPEHVSVQCWLVCLKSRQRPGAPQTWCFMTGQNLLVNGGLALHRNPNCDKT